MIEIRKLLRPNILNLLPYSSARDEFSGLDAIYLDANENPFGTLNRYPDPYQLELKEKLAKLKNLETKNIFIGNGSDELIDLAIRIFCIPGVDKALTFSPTYGMYDVSAAINDISLIKLPLTKNDFQIDKETLSTFLSDTKIKILFLCSPNNPTGNLIDREDVIFILKKFKGVVIIDEAYIDFAQAESTINLVSQYNNLIVSQTLSKAWGLAGIRVGMAYASPEIISLFNKVKAPYNVSALNQKAAVSAIENMIDYKERLKLILKEKERLEIAFRQIKKIKKIYPSEANFLLIELENADQVYANLVSKSIITRNRNKQINNCIRVTVGTATENDKLIEALKTMR